MLSPDADNPTSFGRYKLLQEVGSGGMARVYRAEMQGVGGFSKQVALKVIRPELVLDDQEFIKQFVSEARLGGYLHHINIVETFDFGESDGRLYMAMEYVAGPTLAMIWEGCRRGHEPIPPALAFDIVAQVLEGLGEAHSARDTSGKPLNLIHRDLKPSNIFVSFGGTVKVGDFGVARAESNVMRTMHGGALKGTVRYMSPEQAWGQADLDQRSDLFSVAAIFFELLSGRHLYEGHLYHAVLRAAQDAEIPDIQGCLPPEVRSVGVLSFLAQGLAKDPTLRFANARAMLAALDKLRSGMPRIRLSDWLEGHAYLWDPTAPRPGQRAAVETSGSRRRVDAARTPPPARPEPPRAIPPAIADAFAQLDRSGEDTASSWGDVQPTPPSAPSPATGQLPQSPYARFGALYSDDQAEAPTLQVDVGAMWEEIHRREATEPPTPPAPLAEPPSAPLRPEPTWRSDAAEEPAPQLAPAPEPPSGGGAMSVLRFIFFGILAVAILAGAAWLMTATVEVPRPGPAQDQSSEGDAVRDALSKPPPGVVGEVGGPLGGAPAPEEDAPPAADTKGAPPVKGKPKAAAGPVDAADPGLLFINTFPAGRIAVDGSPVPGSRLQRYSVQAGAHEVTVAWGQGSPLTATVTVKAGEELHCVAQSGETTLRCQ